MNKGSHIITVLTKEELTEILLKNQKELIENILLQKNTPNNNNEILNRKQTADLLGISLSTLWSWTKRKVLNSYGAGKRVYYIKSEVLSALKQLNK